MVFTFWYSQFHGENDDWSVGLGESFLDKPILYGEVSFIPLHTIHAWNLIISMTKNMINIVNMEPRNIDFESFVSQDQDFSCGMVAAQV